MEKEHLKKRYQKIIAISIASFFVVYASFYTGFYFGTLEPKEIRVSGIENEENGAVSLNPFWEVWDLVRSNHIKGDEIENQDLLYGAMAGIVSSLGDPYSVFLPPEDSQKFEEDVRGMFGGVGMEIETRDGRLTVVSPLKGTPADRAGLKAGDTILKVDGEEIVNLDANSAVKKIRGLVGTKVVLTIDRDSFKEPKDFSIVREIIQVPTLEWEMKGDIAYVKLLSFNENTLPLFYEATLKSLFGGARGLVLDLRNNPGGYLEVATRLAGWFVNSGEIVVSERFRDGKQQDFPAVGNEALKNFPTVILVNRGSASASEILAGALRDLRGTELVGETTFGKGTVQELHYLADGSLIKLTIAEWVLPKGQILSGSGLEPDYAVELTDDDLEAGRDPQLDRALAIIRQ